MINGVALLKIVVRFVLRILAGIREAVGEHFIIIYRLSMLDLITELMPQRYFILLKQ